jgi:hypothetical protein
MNCAEAGPARLLRMTGRHWLPVGPVLPPVADDDMHAEELADGVTCYWHLPSDIDTAPGDVLLVRERALRLLGRCGAQHRAVAELRRHPCPCKNLSGLPAPRTYRQGLCLLPALCLRAPSRAGSLAHLRCLPLPTSAHRTVLHLCDP